MEFFEFDNSFIGGYGQLTTDLSSGNKTVTVKIKNTGARADTTCNKVAAFKAFNDVITGGGTCRDDLPYQAAAPNSSTKTSNIEQVKFNRAFK